MIPPKARTRAAAPIYRIKPAASRLAVLASGGLDSSVLLATLAAKRREVYPIYIRAGLKWESNELAMLRRFIRALKSPRIRPVAILSLPMSDVSADHWSVTGRGVPGYRAPVFSNYIIGRNLSLISKAAIFCAYNRIGEVALATLRANPFLDARPEFFHSLSRTIELGVGLPLRIRTPFADLSKAEVIRLGWRLPLNLTLTCAQPHGSIHCGRCTKCAERIEAFREADVPDPTRYAKRAAGDSR